LAREKKKKDIRGWGNEGDNHRLTKAQKDENKGKIPSKLNKIKHGRRLMIALGLNEKIKKRGG